MEQKIQLIPLILVISSALLIDITNGYKKAEFEKCYESGTPLDKIMLSHPDAERYLQLFKSMYQNNFYDPSSDQRLILESKRNKIPKKIHQFYLGDAHSPLYKNIYIETCLKLNPEWEYNLWSLEVIEHEIVHDKKLLKVFKDNQQLSSLKDYIQLLVLNTFGGIFIDADFICQQPFNELAMKFSFFQTLEPPFVFSNIPSTSTVVMGSVKNGFIVQKLLQMFESYYKDDTVMLEINQYCDDPNQNYTQNPILSQLISSKVIFEVCSNESLYDAYCHDIVLLPPCYFLSPYIPKTDYLYYARSKYSGLQQLISYVLNYVIFKDLSNYDDPVSANEKLITQLIRIFLPNCYEEYRFDGPGEYSIAFRDWEEGVNGLYIMNEITQYVKKRYQ